VTLHLVLAESALELVPQEIRNTPAVRSDSRRRGTDPSEIILDRSLHHSSMPRLSHGERRGRPDLVHEAVLSATGTPLFMNGKLKVYVHTNQNLVLQIEEKTRIPKSYNRFRGLAEQLLTERPKSGLVKVYDADITKLVKKVIGADRVVGMSTQGAPTDLGELSKELTATRRPCVLVGGFPRGHFDPAVLRMTDRLVRISPMPLEAHVVVARVVYEVEKATNRIND
jgi:rRNA small subunit pseudouridine methyltransferase Nep1